VGSAAVLSRKENHVKRNLWIVAVAAVLAIGQWAMAEDKPTGGETVVATSQPVLPGAATPKEALERLGNGVSKLDVDLAVSSVAPDYQPGMRIMMVAMKQITTKSQAVKKTVAEKVDAETAEKLFKDMDFTSKGPLMEASKDGKIDWDLIKITEDGDKATVKIGDEEQEDTNLRKIDGKWYVVPGKQSAKEMTKQAGQLAKMMDSMGKALDVFEKNVKDGKVTKDNAQEELGKALMAVMTAAGKNGGDDDKPAPAPAPETDPK
jgi:exonuclease VII small subunit